MANKVFKACSWVFGYLMAFGIIFGFFGLCLLIVVFFHFSHNLPDYNKLLEYKAVEPSILYSSDNIKTVEYGVEKREYIEIEKVPLLVRNAFLAAEDKNFYRHSGIDFFGILKAMIINVKNVIKDRKNARFIGASTITQQVVKNLVLTNERTIERKIKEAIISTKLTKEISKDKILELYLNHIYLGNGAYGVKVAAKIYFNKELKDITISQAAMLASLPKAPSILDKNKARAIVRRNWVISQMAENGFITTKEARIAQKDELKRSSEVQNREFFGHSFNEIVKDLVSEKIGQDALFKGGYKIQTTMDSKVQKAIFDSTLKHFEVYDKRYGYRGPLGTFDAISSIKETIMQTNGIEIETDAIAKTYLMDERFFKIWCENLEGYNNKLPLDKYFPAIIIDIIDSGIFVGVYKKNEQKQCQINFIRNPNMKWIKTGITVNDKFPEDVKSQNRDINVLIKEGDIITTSQRPYKHKIQDREYDTLYFSQVPKVNGATIVMNPKTGEVLGLSGDYLDRPNVFNRAIQSTRQTGSVFKPFVYLTALESDYFNPTTPIVDADISLTRGDSGDEWNPQNHSNRNYGVVSLRYALEKSINIATVRISEILGTKRLTRIFKELDLIDKRLKDLSVALGSVDIEPIRVAKAFAMIANAGYQVEPRYIKYIENQSGEKIFEGYYYSLRQRLYEELLAAKMKDIEQKQEANLNSEEATEDEVYGLNQEEEKEEGRKGNEEEKEADSKSEDEVLNLEEIEKEIRKQVEEALPMGKSLNIDKRSIYQIQSIMKGVVQRGTGVKMSWAKINVAGKTGTTNNSRDSWFVGYNDDYVILTYVGYDDYESLGEYEYGATIALPIVRDIFKEIYNNQPVEYEPKLPDDMVDVRVDYKTGRPTTINQSSIVEMLKPNDMIEDVTAKQYSQSQKVIKSENIDLNYYQNLLEIESEIESLDEEIKAMQEQNGNNLQDDDRKLDSLEQFLGDEEVTKVETNEQLSETQGLPKKPINKPAEVIMPQENNNQNDDDEDFSLFE